MKIKNFAKLFHSVLDFNGRIMVTHSTSYPVMDNDHWTWFIHDVEIELKVWWFLWFWSSCKVTFDDSYSICNRKIIHDSSPPLWKQYTYVILKIQHYGKSWLSLDVCGQLFTTWKKDTTPLHEAHIGTNHRIWISEKHWYL